jgi:hypothetical protein
VFSDFPLELLEGIKGLFIGIVEDKDDAFGLLVENGRKGSKSLLTSCVPDS